MLTANVSKIKKSVLPNITFILKILSEKGIIFVWTGFFIWSKKCKFHKNVFLQNGATWACVNMHKYITSQVSIVWYNSHIVIKSWISYDALQKNSCKRFNSPMKGHWMVSIFTFLVRNLYELSKMGSVKSVAFVVQKILCNLFSMQKV